MKLTAFYAGVIKLILWLTSFKTIFYHIIGYTLAEEGETCHATCVAKKLTCDPAMSGNLKKILSRLGVKCASYQPYNSLDQAQPYVTADKTCHGLFEGEKKISCGASKNAASRLCRCERPGKFCTEC